MKSFESFGLDAEILRAIEKIGFEEPTEIQLHAIPEFMAGKDILGKAQTGTGKTAAYALPILNRLDPKNNAVQALIMTPTRELAIQVTDAMRQFGQFVNIKTLAVYGGQSYTPQLRSLKEGVHVIVGTPGRLIDLVKKKKALNLGQVQTLVLDEADEMLAMGFVEEVEEIIELTPATRQTAFFSATLPKSIRNMAGEYLNEPVEVNIQSKTVTVDQIEQRYYRVRDEDKVAALVRLFEMEDVQSALLFTRTKVRAAEIAEALRARKFPVEALHGDLKQSERERVMGRFRKGYVNIVVATDVAARGIDIENVSHVFNVDVPLDPESYVHRIGRTGRAGRDGTAITLVTPSDYRRLLDIERFVKQDIPSAELPTKEAVQARRDDRFIDTIVAKLAMEEAKNEKTLVNQIIDYGYDPLEIAAAAIQMARASEVMRPIEDIKAPKKFTKDSKHKKSSNFNRSKKKSQRRYVAEAGMVRLSINMGKTDQIRPGNIVGAIANTTGIPGSAIGAIDIQQNKTFLDVSEKYADDVMRKMRNWKMQDKSVIIQSA